MNNFPDVSKFKLKFCVGIMVTALILNGCGMLKGEKKPAQKEEKPIKIGIAMATMEGDGYTAIKKAMEKLKKTEKADLIWMDAKNDEKTQASQIDKLVKQKVKVIILHMVKPEDGRKIVGKLQEQNIRVLAVEKLPENVALDGFVTPDYRRAGELQGEFVAKKLKAGQVLLFNGSGDPMADKMLSEGFRQGLGTGSPLVVKQVETKDNQDPKAVEKEVTKALKENPQAAAIVTQGGPHTMSLIKYLQKKENKDKAKTLTTVGLGADKTASVAVAGEQHDAEVDTRPDLIAYYALKGAKQLAEGQHLEYDQRVKNDESDVPTKVIPVRLIRMDNFYLLKERWGDLKKEAKKAEDEAKKKEAEADGKPKVKITEGKSGEEGGQAGSEGQEQSGGSEGSQEGQAGQKQGSQPKKTKLMIKTKEGKTIEIEVDGDIEEIKSQSGGSGQGQEGQGGSGESGQSEQ